MPKLSNDQIDFGVEFANMFWVPTLSEDVKDYSDELNSLFEMQFTFDLDTLCDSFKMLFVSVTADAIDYGFELRDLFAEIVIGTVAEPWTGDVVDYAVEMMALFKEHVGESPTADAIDYGSELHELFFEIVAEPSTGRVVGYAADITAQFNNQVGESVAADIIDYGCELDAVHDPSIDHYLIALYNRRAPEFYQPSERALSDVRRDLFLEK